ncbi:hypothetical protein EXIGLDRAFT_363781 [Exidia glandulosa HHB12029]|uniref:Zinc-finger domain-containing protein n=1 Tax=Exidia glandulosa HHB12029 TaxID=1314781 RepID=A0A165C4R3_EXIGL|nr:hypothetical protein EXIGLDRAFT_363781 [Exidia glandulosa HHB12029]
MTAPAPAPKQRMLFDGVFLPPPPPAAWLDGAIMFPVSRTKKQKKRQRDENDLERPPKKKQRTSGARVESPIELDQDEDYHASDTEDDDDRPPPPPAKTKKSPTKPRPRRRRKTKEKVVDTTMKTPDELRIAAAQERVCHQCRNSKITARRVPCGRKNCTLAYCERCLELRYDYTSTSLTSPPSGACPSCRGNCNCSVCLTKRGLEDHMPHLRALAKEWDKNKGKNKQGAVCPRVWLERERLLREREEGRWVVDERVDAEEWEERARTEREEMVRSGRRWYVGLPPPPPVRPVFDVPSAPSTIDGDDEGDGGERDSLFDGPYTPDAPPPISARPIDAPDSLFNGSCTPLTPSEQDRDLALGLDEDNDKDSLFDGPFTWDDLDTDSPEDALRVETELALVLGDDDAEASTDPDYVDVVVREAIIGTREPVKKAEELSGLLGEMSDLSTPTPSLTSMSASTSTLHAPSSTTKSKTNSALKASSSSCTVVTVSSSVTATQPTQDDEEEDEGPDEHPDYDCSHLRRPFVACKPPRIVGLPLRWVPAPMPAPELVTKRKRKAEKQQRVVKRPRVYEEDDDDEDEDEDSETLSLYTDRSSDDGAEAFNIPRRGAGAVRRRGGKASARTRKREDSSSPSTRSPKTPHLVDPYYYTDTSSYSYSYPPDPTPTHVEPVFVPDEVVDESMRGSKADDVFLLPAPVEFGWDEEEEGRMVIDVEAVADAWKSLGAIGIGL